jgi:hypothetical protein
VPRPSGVARPGQRPRDLLPRGRAPTCAGAGRVARVGVLARGSPYSPRLPTRDGQWLMRLSFPHTVAGQRRLRLPASLLPASRQDPGNCPHVGAHIECRWAPVKPDASAAFRYRPSCPREHGHALAIVSSTTGVRCSRHGTRDASSARWDRCVLGSNCASRPAHPHAGRSAHARAPGGAAAEAELGWRSFLAIITS